VQPKGLTGASVKKSGMSKSEHPVANGGKDHGKHNGKRPKLTFDKLLAKYKKDNEVKRANRSNKVKSSRLPPKHNSGNWNRQKRVFNQQHHILLLSHQCRFHMPHVPLVFIHIHHGGGVIHGHILLHI
jgi:hypothetical protein